MLRYYANGCLLLLLIIACCGSIVYALDQDGVITAIESRLNTATLQVTSQVSLSETLPSYPSISGSKSGYVELAKQDAIAAGIPPVLFVRQINQESGFNPNEVSPAGAEGIAQFMPDTAQGLGIDPWNPVQALQGAAQLMARYQHNYGGDYAKALAAYNGGSGTLQGCIDTYDDQWLSCEPAETQRYVRAILGQ